MGELQGNYEDEIEVEVNDVWYKVAFVADWSYFYDPGRMYMPNGDPGYPPEEEFDVDITIITSIQIYDEDKGNFVDFDPGEALKETLEAKVYDHCYDCMNDVVGDVGTCGDYYDEEPEEEMSEDFEPDW